MNSPGISKRGNSAQTSKHSTKDFILISEFSELVGPVEVLAIPRNDELNFDKAAYSVRVLSSDLQANRKFAIVHDSQILQSIPTEDMHAYIHYMTLNDISARGYVRQFCMSYISRKEKKLVDNFLALKESFGKVSTMLRCANLTLFFIDLIHKLKDFYYTAELIEQEGLVYEDESDFTTSQLYSEFNFCTQDVPERDIKVVKQQIDEATEILNIVVDEMSTPSNKKALQLLNQGGPHTLEHIENSISSVKQQGVSFVLHELETDYQPCRTMAHITYRFDRKLKTLPLLCNKPVYDIAKVELEQIQKRFSRQFFVLNIEEEEAKLLDPLSSLLTIGRTPVMNMLENRMCNGQQVTSQPRPYKYSSLHHLQVASSSGGDLPFFHLDSEQADKYSFDNSFLLSTGCLEMFPMYIDPLPHHNSNLTENVDEVDLNLSRSLPSAVDHQTLDPASITSDLNDQFVTPMDSSPSMHSLSNSSPPVTPSGIDDVIAVNTLTSHHVAKLNDGITDSGFVLVGYPDDFRNDCVTSGDQLDVESTLKPSQLAMTFPKDQTSDCKVEDSDEVDYDKTCGVHANNRNVAHNDSASGTDTVVNMQINVTENQVVGVSKYSLNADTSPLTARATGVSNVKWKKRGTLSDLKLPAYGTSSPEYYTPTDVVNRDPMSPLGIVRTPLFEHPVVRVTGKVPIISYTDQCIRHYKMKLGRKIPEFIKNHPNCQDFFYALLSGRPLVISGPSQIEQKIRSVVLTLWMFVPGFSRHCQVIPWHKEPIKLQDLLHFKLIGHCHTHHVIPQHILPYISWWNYHEGKLYTPRYDGTLLNSISRRTDWKSESMLMAHIHSVLLDIASRAFVYYHHCCVAKQQEESKNPLNSPVSKERSASVKANIFPKLNIDKQCDKDIIQYFADVISQQQLAEWEGQATNGIRLNYKKCLEQSCRGH